MELGSTSVGGLGGIIADMVRRYEQRLQEKDRQIEELKAKLVVYEKNEATLNKVSEDSKAHTRSEYAD